MQNFPRTNEFSFLAFVVAAAAAIAAAALLFLASFVLAGLGVGLVLYWCLYVVLVLTV